MRLQLSQEKNKDLITCWASTTPSNILLVFSLECPLHKHKSTIIQTFIVRSHTSSANMQATRSLKIIRDSRNSADAVLHTNKSKPPNTKFYFFMWLFELISCFCIRCFVFIGAEYHVSYTPGIPITPKSHYSAPPKIYQQGKHKRPNLSCHQMNALLLFMSLFLQFRNSNKILSLILHNPKANSFHYTLETLKPPSLQSPNSLSNQP